MGLINCSRRKWLLYENINLIRCATVVLIGCFLNENNFDNTPNRKCKCKWHAPNVRIFVFSIRTTVYKCIHLYSTFDISCGQRHFHSSYLNYYFVFFLTFLWVLSWPTIVWSAAVARPRLSDSPSPSPTPCLSLSLFLSVFHSVSVLTTAQSR